MKQVFALTRRLINKPSKERNTVTKNKQLEIAYGLLFPVEKKHFNGFQAHSPEFEETFNN